MKQEMVQGELFRNWNGHEMTVGQSSVCENATGWLYDWDLPVPEGIEETYEDKTGRSCVYWGKKDCPYPNRDDLPRDEGYVTGGYSSKFISWVCDGVYRAVCLEGISDKDEILKYAKEA